MTTLLVDSEQSRLKFQKFGEGSNTKYIPVAPWTVWNVMNVCTDIRNGFRILEPFTLGT